MDRGHRLRAILSGVAAGGVALLALTASAGAQAPSPAAPVLVPAPSAPVLPTATPWVQASPPASVPPAKPASIVIRVDREGRYFFDKEKDAVPADQLAERLRKLREAQGEDLRVVIRAEQETNYAAVTTALERAHDAGIKNLLVSPTAGAKAPPPGGPALSAAAASPSASPSREETAKAMARKREDELAKAPPTPNKPPLSPDEREIYERNLGLWLAMPPEERQAIRGQATERINEETEKAYESSGLSLNDDQREVFALRYRQERRRLERELQEKARAERARRLPEIMERLKHEFPAMAAAGTPRPPPKPTPAPTASVPPPAVPK